MGAKISYGREVIVHKKELETQKLFGDLAVQAIEHFIIDDGPPPHWIAEEVNTGTKGFDPAEHEHLLGMTLYHNTETKETTLTRPYPIALVEIQDRVDVFQHVFNAANESKRKKMDEDGQNLARKIADKGLELGDLIIPGMGCVNAGYHNGKLKVIDLGNGREKRKRAATTRR